SMIALDGKGGLPAVRATYSGSDRIGASVNHGGRGDPGGGAAEGNRADAIGELGAAAVDDALVGVGAGGELRVGVAAPVGRPRSSRAHEAVRPSTAVLAPSQSTPRRE